MSKSIKCYNNILNKLICSDSLGSSQYAIGNIDIKEVRVFIYNNEATTPKISKNSNEVINLLIDYLKFCNTPNPDGTQPSCYISIGTGMWVITSVNTSYGKESDEWWVCKFRKYLGKSEHAIVAHEIRMGMMDIKEYSILEKISKVMSK